MILQYLNTQPMTVMDGTIEHVFKDENYLVIPDEIALKTAQYLQHKKPLSFKIIDTVKKKGEVTKEQAAKIEPDFELVSDAFKDELGGQNAAPPDNGPKRSVQQRRARKKRVTTKKRVITPKQEE